MAQRNPKWMPRSLGRLLPRWAQAASSWSLNQEPPRTTRYSSSSDPRLSVHSQTFPAMSKHPYALTPLGYIPTGVVLSGPPSRVLHRAGTNSSPHGYSRFTLRAGSHEAARSHSSSVGSRNPGPRHRQKRRASYQFTHNAGWSSASE